MFKSLKKLASNESCTPKKGDHNFATFLMKTTVARLAHRAGDSISKFSTTKPHETRLKDDSICRRVAERKKFFSSNRLGKLILFVVTFF